MVKIRSCENLWRRATMCALPLLLSAAGVGALEPGAPIFSDSFDTPATFAENWVSKGQIKSADGRAEMKSGALTLRRDTPLEFYAEFDLTLFMDDPARPLGFGGMMVGNCRFQLKPEGKTFLLWTAMGAGRSSGKYLKIDGYEKGRPVRLGVYRTVKDDLATYTYLVNGKNMGSFVQKAPQKKHGKYSPLFFTSWRVDRMHIDNFSLCAVKKDANESPNLVINSSFEHLQDNYPLYFARSDANLNNYVDVPYENFIKAVSADDMETHSGKYSLRIIADESAPSHTIWAHSAGTAPDRPGVLSVWLKSDRDDFPVTIAYGSARREVRVGNDWKRYEVVNPKLPKPFVYSPVTISVRNARGTLWIDDVQAEFLEKTPSKEEIESGRTFASEYRPSELDQAKFAETSKLVRAAPFSIPRLSRASAPVGDLDSWKDKAVELKDFYYKSKPARNKTECYLACDARNLYISYRCFVQDLSKISVEPHPRDWFGLFGRESIEFFLNPESDGIWSHFAADAGNTLTDMGRGNDVAWNGNWTSVAKKNEKTNSIDYVATVPFAEVASPAMKPVWLLSVCRNDGTENQTLYANERVLYKEPRLWPRVTLPEEVVTNYTLGAEKGFISEGMNGITVSFDLNNASGRSREVKAELLDLEDGGAKIGERVFSFAPGAGKLSFAVKEATGKVALEFTEDGEPLASQRFVLEKRDPVSVLGRLSFYMNEPEAVFKVTTSLPNADKLTATLECAGKEVERAAAPVFKIALPLKGVEPGTYEAKLTIRGKGKALGAARGRLVKREYWEGATQINHFSRSLMHRGKPVFQFAPFVGDFHFTHVFTEEQVRNQLAILDRYGFKYAHVLVSFRKDQSVTSGIAFFDEAVKRDFKVMLWTKYTQVSEDKWPELMKTFKFPNILSQMVMDEPELSTPSDKALAFLRKMRPLFPYHPTHMNNTVLGIPNRYANLETDIIMLDDYLTNSEKRTVASVVNNADLMWKSGAEEGKPCFYFLVCANFPLHYREPSYAEQIAQTYGCIAAGCTGLSYFYGWPKTMGNWKAYLQLNREMKTLGDVITSEEACSAAAATGNPKLMRIRAKRYDGYVYLIACNIDGEPAGRATMTLPTEYRYARKAEVLFEDRKVRVRDGQLIDNFAAHTRHVYRIKLR